MKSRDKPSPEPLISRQPLATSVCDHLRAALAEGRYAGGMPGERRLAEELSVSRRVVREALAILTHEGLLARPVSGFVRDVRDVARARPVARRRIGFMTGTDLLHAEPSVLSLFAELRKLAETFGAECVYIVEGDCRPQRAAAEALEMLERYACDVWVASGILSTRGVVELHRLGAVVVGHNFIGDYPFPVVSVDHSSAILHAMNLVFRRARTRPVYLRVIPDVVLAEAVRKLMESRGLAFDESRVLPLFDGTKAGYVAVLERLFDSDAPPDAVIGLTTVRVEGVTIQGFLQSRRLKCPDDVSMVLIHEPPYRDRMYPVPDVYREDEARIMRMIVSLVGTFLRTGEMPAARRSVFMEYLPGGSL